MTSRKGVPSLPGVPTLRDARLKNFEVVVGHGLYVPKGTPKPVIDKLVSALQAAVKDPTFKTKLAELGAEPVPVTMATPVALQTHLKAEIDVGADHQGGGRLRRLNKIPGDPGDSPLSRSNRSTATTSTEVAASQAG